MDNIFLIISFVDISLLTMLFFLGWYSKEKEFKDVWGDNKTMEATKSNKLHKEWKNNHPILSFFENFYYELRRKKDIPRDTYNKIKWFIQRGKRGYADCDIWNFSGYLSNILVNGLKELKDQVHGHPISIDCSHHTVDIEGESKGTKKWKKIIDKMIWTFEVTNKILERDWIPVFDEKYRIELRDYVKRLNRRDKKPLFDDLPKRKYHLMTKREMQKYNSGWKLFKDYYINLWD